MTRRGLLYFIFGCAAVSLGAQAHALSRAYLAFFDWDSAVVSDRSRLMVEEFGRFYRLGLDKGEFVHVVGASDGDDDVRDYAIPG